jgi:DNA-binding SARP family transcriptional activator
VQLEFRLLGEIAVLADGRPLDLGGIRQRSVLAILLLQRDRAISTDLLADRLWSEDQPLSAIKTVQVYVSRLRHALGPEAGRLTSTASGYRLAVADDEFDVARFERGLRQAREALAAGSAERARTTLETALGNWSGPALGDVATEPFARREADRLEELRLQAVEELYEMRIGEGSGREAIAELRRLVAQEPGRERLWRLLMLALYADGRQGEALEAYQEARRYLTDELGLDPSPELQDLERAILTQEAPRPSLAPLALAAAAVDTVPSTDEDDGTATAETTATSTTVPPIDVEPGGRRTRRVVTVLRARIVRATADGGLDPEILEGLERRSQDLVRHAVERHGGIIERADQDGVTAVFGLAIAREDDALRAVRAAAELRGEPGAAGTDGVVLAVGVATGEVLAGMVTDEGTTVTGAPLQHAARLAERAGDHEVLLTGDTERLVRGATSTEPAAVDAEAGSPTSSIVRLVDVTEGEAIERRMTTPFVGRGAELDSLALAFEHVATEGVPGLVTVIGAPGVGKSRLVAESLARLADRATVLRSRCLPYGEGITFWPVRELVQAASGIEHGEPALEALAKLDPIVTRLERGDLVRRGIASILGMTDAPVAGEEIPWAVRRFMEALAADRPLVLVVDDLQWAEPVLAELLDHVLDLGRGPILLITIARPELEEVRPDWLARSSLALIRLDALTDADAASLLDHLAPELPPGQLRSRILATAEGNPLFVEQFVAYTADEAVAGNGILDERTAVDLPIPPTIGALLAARLDRVPDAERRVLERAAVIGRTFWTGALTDLLPDAERSEVARRLARLSRRDLIRPQRSDFADDDAYRFRHLLIRDAAYAGLPKRERSELHARFADWLERRAVDHPAAVDLILGYHLEQAYRYRRELGDERGDARSLADRALRILAPAGLAAQDRGDAHAAVSLLGRAVDLAPLGRDRVESQIALRAALRTAGRREESDAVDAEVVTWLAEHPDEGLEHRRRLNDAQFGDPYTPAEAEAAYRYYESVGDELGMIRALHAGSNAHAGDGRFTLAIELLDQAIDLADRIGQADRTATLFGRSAFVFAYGPIPVPDGMARLRRHLESEGGNRQSRALVLMALGQLEARSVDPADWRRHFDAAKEIIDDLGLVIPMGAFGYPLFLGDTELHAGDPARAVDMLTESCATLDRLGDFIGGLASMAPLTARVLLAAGQPDEVERYAFWGRDIAEADDVEAHAEWRLAISGLRTSQGRHDEATSLAREAIDLVAEREMAQLLGDAKLTLARASRAAGDEPGALAAAEEAHRIADAKGDQAALRSITAFMDAPVTSNG